ncbi:hypothetical protein OUZ56_004442 [Daphnia magna]|uniref:Uncharacterized protein n=1 Tax=Daphnia magna TaxID=35525 RepID=A0ABQ9YPU4_9CRUS|nr:hypothetical protein OUZ56_004442 [Daphnia magna]
MDTQGRKGRANNLGTTPRRCGILKPNFEEEEEEEEEEGTSEQSRGSPFLGTSSSFFWLLSMGALDKTLIIRVMEERR